MLHKILVFASIISVIILSACGTKIDASEVPSAVVTNFEKQHPSVIAKWEMEDGNYEVNFSENGKEMSGLYTADGTMMESEVSISVSELPAKVQVYLNTNFAGKKVEEAARITKADGTITFEAEVNGADQIFDADGNFIKTVKE